MECPNCGLKQPDKAKDCAGCQINFSHWKEVQAKREYGGYAAPSSTQATGPLDRKSRPWGWILVLVSAVSLGLWLFTPRRGLPIPDEAHKNQAYGFAISPAPGWNHSFPGNKKGRFVDAFSMLKSAPEGRMPPVLNVVVTETPVPPMTDRLKDRAAKIVESELKGVFEGYSRQSAQIIEIDRLKALRVTGTGQKTVVVIPAVYKTILSGTTKILITPETTKVHDLKVISIIVPGLERGYLITCIADLADFPVLEGDFSYTLASFRVLEHPLPFAPAIKGPAKVFAVLLLAGLAAASALMIVRRHRRKF